MSDWEDELKQALGRKQPSPGFTGRVIHRLNVAPQRRGPSRLAAVLAIAACTLLFVGNREYDRYRGLQAKKQLLLALEITGSKLSIAQRKVQDLSQRTIHDQ